MIVDAVSDLHGHFPALEGGDLLIIGGDIVRDGYNLQEYITFEKEWLRFQKYRKKIVIAGNHDVTMQALDWQGTSYFDYLQDSSTEFEGLKIYGSPWTCSFEGMNPDCMAFTVDTEEELAEKFAAIPDDVNILITHSPIFGIFDQVVGGERVGSVALGLRLSQISRLNTLKLHVCGHIHESYGLMRSGFYINNEWQDYYFANASHVNEHYQPINKPLRIIL